MNSTQRAHQSPSYCFRSTNNHLGAPMMSPQASPQSLQPSEEVGDLPVRKLYFAPLPTPRARVRDSGRLCRPDLCLDNNPQVPELPEGRGGHAEGRKQALLSLWKMCPNSISSLQTPLPPLPQPILARGSRAGMSGKGSPILPPHPQPCPPSPFRPRKVQAGLGERNAVGAGMGERPELELPGRKLRLVNSS